MPRGSSTASLSAPGSASATGAIGALVAGTALLVAAGAMAWLAACTPLVHRLAAPLAHGPAMMLAWPTAATLAAVAATGCALAGVLRIGTAVEQVRMHGTSGPLVSRMAHRLPAHCVVYPVVWLPDGRCLSEVVVGPFGAVVFAPLPRSGSLRQVGGSWEVRTRDGSWEPMEHPAQRVLRDAERLRHLLAGEERDFIVRVTAAVVGDAETGDPAGATPVVRPADIPAWLAALRPQRSLDGHRLGQVQAWMSRLT